MDISTGTYIALAVYVIYVTIAVFHYKSKEQKGEDEHHVGQEVWMINMVLFWPIYFLGMLSPTF